MANKISFLMFANHYPIIGFRAGSEIVPIQDMKFFLENNCRFNVVTSEAGHLLYKQGGVVEGEDVHFHVVSTPGAEKVGLALEYLLRTVKAIFFALSVNVTNYDVVKSNSDWGVFDFLPAVILKARKKRLVWAAVCWHLLPLKRRGRGLLSSTNVVGFLSQRLMLWLIKNIGDLVFTETEVNKDTFTRLGISSDKVKVVRGALDSSFVRSIPGQEKIFHAAYLGRLHPEKGVFDLIKIWESICGKKRDAKLAVMGSATPQWVNAFKNEVQKRDLEKNIIILGNVSEEEKYRILKMSRVFLHTSFEEGLPIAVCEAMACGLPVVAYDLPTYKDGWMMLDFVRIPVGNKEKFVDAIFNLLSDEGKREKYILNKEKALEYTYQNRAYAMLNEIKKCLD